MADKKNKNVAIVIVGGLDAAARKVIETAIAGIEGLKYELVEGVVSEADHAAVVLQNKDLLADVGSLKDKVAAADAHILKLTEEITAMSAELDTAQEAAEKGYLTVKSGKKTYRVAGKKFNFKGSDYTIDDLIKNQKLIDELVGLKVGFLTEIKEDK